MGIVDSTKKNAKRFQRSWLLEEGVDRVSKLVFIDLTDQEWNSDQLIGFFTESMQCRGTSGRVNPRIRSEEVNYPCYFVKSRSI